MLAGAATKGSEADPLTRQIGRTTYAETMEQFQGQILPPNHPVTRRVRDIAKRIVERNGLGLIKEGHSLSTIEQVMGAWEERKGMESPENIQATEQPNPNAEWEVSLQACRHRLYPDKAPPSRIKH